MVELPIQPDVHAVDPEERNDASEAASSTNQSEFEHWIKDEDPYVTPKSPYPSSPKIQSTGVNQPQEPIHEQKRRGSISSTPALTEPTKEVSCAGLEGSPWPENEQEDRRSQRDEEEEDYKEYFEHRKASPLSELDLVDTRKPITRATDGTADSYYGEYDTRVMLWKPEQLDTAEDSLHRAPEIWRNNAMRGDPDSSHGRILRALRGEYW